MLSNVNVINVVLAGALLLFINYAVLPMFGKTAKITLPVPKKQSVANAPAPEKPAEPKTASPADYVVIAEQNLFHPERKIPVEKKDLAAPPLPKPEFVLYGTLLMDDLRIAYMEDRKAPQNAPTRGKKQIPVKLGESLSGFILKEIDPGKVVMVRGEEKINVSLNDTTIPKDRTFAQTAGNVTTPARPGQQPAASHPGKTVPPAPAPALAPAPAPALQSVEGQTPLSTPSGSKAVPSGADTFRRIFRR